MSEEFTFLPELNLGNLLINNNIHRNNQILVKIKNITIFIKLYDK